MHHIRGTRWAGRVRQRTVSVKVIPGVAAKEPEMSDSERQEALAQFDRYFARLDARAAKMDPDEEEAVLTEAIRSVRPNYRPMEVTIVPDSTFPIRAHNRSRALPQVYFGRSSPASIR